MYSVANAGRIVRERTVADAAMLDNLNSIAKEEKKRKERNSPSSESEEYGLVIKAF